VTDLGVIFGGPSPEHDVSVLTGLQAAHELARSAGDRIHGLYWTKAGDWFEVDPSLEAEAFVQGVPGGATPLRLTVGDHGGFTTEGGRLGRSRHVAIDVAVVCCHGSPGEDGTLQGALDLAGLTYTGPDVAAAALGMDKLAFAALMATADLPVLPRVALEEGTDDVEFPGPYIVKPRFGGSSIGIDVVADLQTARARLASNPHLRRGAVLEPYRQELFDLQLAVRCWPALQVSAVERPLRQAAVGAPAAVGASPSSIGGEILGYADKYVGGEGMASAPRELPANVEQETTARLTELARRIAELSMVRGVARVDFLSDGSSVWVNEVNTIPGSLARYLWIDPPVSFTQLLGDMIEEARTRPSRAYSAAGADGTVLRGASAIAAKLA
jgi:D-alanine-D-alanine ligase